MPATEGPRTYLLGGIFTMLLLYTLYFARSVVLPILLALLLSLLLTPLVRALAALWIPRPLGAAVVLLTLMGFIGGGFYLLADPAREWLSKAPRDLREVEIKLRALKTPIAEVQKATEQVEKITALGDQPAKVVVAVEQPTLAEAVLSWTPAVLAQIGVTVILLYFLLATGDSQLRKIVRLMPDFHEKRRTVELATRVQHDIASYLFTITVINAGLGAAVAGALYLLAMPNPLLWGAMAALLNFAPYLGAAIGFVVLSFAALLTFDDLSHAALVPAVYLGLTSLEGQLITPAILGRRLSLNPVVIFLFITVWGWLWGIVGVLIAVPLLASIKILCEQVESLHPLADFLDRR
ncbi:MAG: AI-2E family transporter [Pseudomonadota bacterium]|nr:AI-2E family transporter [Pseudomonadota bacterium]